MADMILQLSGARVFAGSTVIVAGLPYVVSNALTISIPDTTSPSDIAALGPIVVPASTVTVYPTPFIKTIDAAFTKAFPKQKLVFHALNVGFTFEAMLIAADAYKRAGSTNRTALTEAIRRTNITSRMMIGGPIKFNAKGQAEGILSACVQNLNQRPTVVLPPESAEAKPVFPMPKV